jgi:hypothetical protein
VNPFLLAHLEGLQQLSIMSLFCHHACLIHRNFNKFFLQWVSNGDIKSGRRKAAMVLLHGDVARLRLEPSIWFSLSLSHPFREPR